MPWTEHKKGADADAAAYPHSYKYPRPGLTADTAVLRIGGPDDPDCPKLHVLLIKRKKSPYQGEWALPGGFVDEHEDIAVAAAREVQEETGLTGLRLYEVGAFGMPRRDPRGHTVTICYTTVVSDKIADTARAADDAIDTQWACVEALPPLAFDHAEILRVTLRKIARGIALGDSDITWFFHAVDCHDRALSDLGRSAFVGTFKAAEAWAAVVSDRTEDENIVARANQRLEEAKQEIPGINGVSL